MSQNNVNKYVELTNLKSPSSKEIKKLVQTANEKKYYGVCLQPGDLGVAAKYRDPELKLITVLGFPPIVGFKFFAERRDPRLQVLLGPHKTEHVEETKRVIDSPNVDEVDIVFPMYWYAQGNFKRIYSYFSGVRKRFKGTIKVICELGTIFTDRVTLYEQAALINDAGLDFYKTNTGLIPQDFKKLMSNIVQLQVVMEDMKCSNFTPPPIKASGGIRTVEQAEKLINLGVKRIGSSSLTETREVKNEQQ